LRAAESRNIVWIKVWFTPWCSATVFLLTASRRPVFYIKAFRTFASNMGVIKSTTFDVAVIGGGPAGLIAAGRAAQLGGKVVLLEKMKQPGRKLLITGNGRCNISHAAPLSTYFKNIFPTGRFLVPAFKTFFIKDLIALLAEQGVATTTEEDNRIFPESNKAQDVLHALLRWGSNHQVTIHTQTQVRELVLDDNSVVGIRALHEDTEILYTARQVILCTGGKSYPATGSTGDGYLLARQAGHSITEPLPALVPLTTAGDLTRKLQGLALQDVAASLWVNGKKNLTEFGELLFAHFGLTGPAILSLSRFAVDELHKGHKVEVHLDLLPDVDEEKLDSRMLSDLNVHGKKQIDNIVRLWIPSKLVPELLTLTAIDGKKEGHQLSARERRNILRYIKDWTFEITGSRGFKEAMITSGGVPTHEIDCMTMQSDRIHNLYFAGEVIDQDAKTGGYNLQIAYSTAYLAASSCMEKLKSSN